jgi:hypothetical protein
MASQFINDQRERARERERERKREREDHENWLSSIFFVLWCVFSNVASARKYVLTFMWFRNPGHWWTSFLHATTFITSSSPPLKLFPPALFPPGLHLKDIKTGAWAGDFVGPNACNG